MIPIPGGVKVWIASRHVDMRKGMQGLGLIVQEHFMRDPFAGDVFVFRGRGGSLIKAIWHDGLGLSLYAKRLDRGRFLAGDEGRDDPADDRSDELSFGRDRLAKAATHLASQERRLGAIKVWGDCILGCLKRAFL